MDSELKAVGLSSNCKYVSYLFIKIYASNMYCLNYVSFKLWIIVFSLFKQVL